MKFIVGKFFTKNLLKKQKKKQLFKLIIILQVKLMNTLFCAIKVVSESEIFRM